MTFNPIDSLATAIRSSLGVQPSLGPAGPGRSGSVQSAIADASRTTGVDFNYLLGQAQLESGMRTDARARTSSASGLYQFIDQSWLRVVKQHGAEHGLGWAADNIRVQSNGRMAVDDPSTRRAILALRNDPATASIMAAEHAADNKTAIEASLGRSATGTDLYMAHFLGLGGARSFLTAMQTSPDRSGAAMFPAAAHANHQVFFAANGQPRSLADIYDRFASKLDSGAAAVGATGSAANPLRSYANAADLAAITNAADLAAKTNAADLAGMTIGGAEVIAGSGDSRATASSWAQTTLDRLNQGSARVETASMIRPTPGTARLAYLMLASLGA